MVWGQLDDTPALGEVCWIVVCLFGGNGLRNDALKKTRTEPAKALPRICFQGFGP